eukprot:CAMPEP_0196575122 /NCGR_PEP_ID=MMETSP1081-20130531/4674_1 /TAXON_ID=36882 /ORGANISM="Pyramimonas amylifera, Strain CCMP720" /LENGTH=547 /DNA_ID=CAMNT_0041893325 /DNA_START=116 /DNA_END=1759 /DNA_ORIENTATION=+
MMTLSPTVVRVPASGLSKISRQNSRSATTLKSTVSHFARSPDSRLSNRLNKNVSLSFSRKSTLRPFASIADKNAAHSENVVASAQAAFDFQNAIKKVAMVAVAVATVTAAGPASAATGIVAADTAWVLTSTALVLFMTIPGLSAFYAGLVKRSNTLSVLMQCFAITCLMTVLWFSVGYSLCFSTVGMVEGAKGLHAFIGGLDKSFLSGITMASVQGTIPEALWALFQMTFAIITPALMVGSFVERMKFSAVMWYVFLWSFVVYFPACHMVWGGAGGYFADMGVIDFAGGIVVHITAGIGALVAAMMCGPRKENEMACSNLVLTTLGTGMLWVGWFGFNGGSAVSAGSEAAFACLATQISAATAAIVWLAQDIMERGKTSLLGICTGSIAGLAAVTPAAGSVGPLGALLIGACSGVICRVFSTTVKEKFGYDDSLDVFGVHGVGGFLGTILLGVFGNPMFGGFLTTSIVAQTSIQTFAAVTTAAYTAVASYLCLKVVGVITGGIRVPEEGEDLGLDEWCHGEICYGPAVPSMSSMEIDAMMGGGTATA